MQSNHNQGINPILWDKAFSVGVVRLDLQHQLIIKVINELVSHQTNQTSVPVFDLLKQLIDYSTQHFETEEQILARYSYPDLEKQKSDHLDYALKMTEFYKEALKRKQHLPNELLSFIAYWWKEHVLVDDMQFKSFLIDKNVS